MNRELVMSTLFGLLTKPPAVFSFTANLGTGSTALGNVSNTTGLSAGLPISGAGIAEHTLLATVTPTVTLSQPATADMTASQLTQGFQTTSRRLNLAYEEADMPALYLLDVAELHLPRQPASPGQIIIDCQAWLFTDAGEDPNPDFTPATELNALIDAVQKALDPVPTYPGGRRQNLGLNGVNYCRIEGELQKDPGYNGRLAIAIVPIKISIGQDIDNYPLS